MGIVVESCPTTKFETYSLEGFRMVLVETPSNPGLDLCDLKSVMALLCDDRRFFAVGFRGAEGGLQITHLTSRSNFQSSPAVQRNAHYVHSASAHVG
jgi:hypothetical protein